MSKILLVGPAGCGKTRLLLNEFVEALEKAPDPLADDSFFILPSAEHTERVTSLLLQRGLKGFFHRRVTTLSELLYRFLGLGQEHFISGGVRTFLLQDILRQNPWDYFCEVQGMPGFHALVARFLDELKDSLFSAAHFRERMNHLKKIEPDLAPKYESLAGIYEAYQGRLAEEGLRDRKDAWTLFLEERPKALARKKRYRKIWLDGFFDFTPLQLAYLRELAESSEEVTVTLTKDQGDSRSGLFESIQQTEAALLEMGFKMESLKPVYHRSTKPALVFLERRLFSESNSTPSPPPNDALMIFEAVGIQGEVEMMAREIHRLYQTGSYRLSDFALLFRQIGSYEAVIRSVFNHYDIPFEIHERERLKLSPMVHALVLLLRVMKDGWKRSDLLNFFKSSYVAAVGETPKNYEWVGEFEHRSLREGALAGREVWLTDWTHQGFGGPGEDLERFNQIKSVTLAPLRDLEDELRSSEDFNRLRTLISEALQKTFRIIQIQDSLETSVRREALSFRRLESLFEEMKSHLRISGRAKVSFDDFADYLLRLIELDLYSLHEQDKNRVQIYDASLARQKEYRIVFVAGLLEKGFPVQIKEDPLLSDWERRLLNAHSEARLAERLPRQSLERYLFYLAVTRASERVTLCYPSLDREGKQALPSFYVEEVQSIFGGKVPVQKQNLAHPFPRPEEAVNLRELEIAVVGELCNPETEEKREPALLYLTHTLLKDPGSRTRIRRSFAEIKAELTDPRLREMDALRSHETSSTRLEEYGKCPYRYFANRILKLQDPDEEINLKRKGTILHLVLENYFRFQREHAGTDLSWEKVERLILQELEASLAQYPLNYEKKYQVELNREELKDMLLRFMRSELKRLRDSKLKPRYFEFSFGDKDGDAAPAYVLETEGEPVKISGKIDRIDTDAEEHFGLVIDYKRSAEFKKDDLEFGTSLQLPIYLTAVEKFLALKPVGGELYSLRKCQKKGFYHAENAASQMSLSARALQFSEKEYRELIERSLGFARRYVSSVANLEIPVRPRYCDPYCPFPAVCRIEKWKLPSIEEEIKEEDRKRQRATADAEKVAK